VNLPGHPPHTHLALLLAVAGPTTEESHERGEVQQREVDDRTGEEVRHDQFLPVEVFPEVLGEPDIEPPEVGNVKAVDQGDRERQDLHNAADDDLPRRGLG